MPTHTVLGRAVHHREAGTGAPLVLLHAFPVHSRCFTPQLEGLSSGRRVLAPDFRGFGESAPGGGPGPAEMSALAADIFAWLDALRIERAVIGGVSMGGYVAMAMVREDPSRVAGLVLMGTHARADEAPARDARETTAQKVLAEGMEVLVQSMVPRLLAPDAPAARRSEVAELIRENSPPGAAAALRGMALRPDSREVLARFAGPALVISGENDAMIPAERAQELAGLIAGARHVRIPRAGHLVFLDAPAETNAAIDAFLPRG